MPRTLTSKTMATERTTLIKLMMEKRDDLRKQGRTEEADILNKSILSGMQDFLIHSGCVASDYFDD